MYEFKLPDLGEGVHEGEILKWHVEPGATVKEDEPLIDVETDKAAITIPSPRSGRIQTRTGNVGDVVVVGNVLVIIDDGTGAVSGDSSAVEEPGTVAVGAASTAVSAGQAKKSNNKAAASSAAVPVASWGRVIAAPATRKLARELNIDIKQVPPTGSTGRVTPDDVRRFADQPGGTTPGDAPTSADRPAEETPTPAGTAVSGVIPFLEVEPLPDFEQWGRVEVEPIRSIRRKVARKMVTSMILAPHVAHMDEADVTELEGLRRREKQRREDQPGGKMTMLSFVVKAVTAGLKASPAFNASLDPIGERIIYKKYYNVGVAVDTGRGLIVPVIKDTDRKSILEISAEIEEAAAKARAGELSVDDLRGGTFTITNVGALGGTGMVPTINYPEVAILGMSRMQDKPVVRDGEIVIRKMLPVTLAFDHRVADGADAARFATEIVRRLSDPTTLLVEA